MPVTGKFSLAGTASGVEIFTPGGAGRAAGAGSAVGGGSVKRGGASPAGGSSAAASK